MPSSQEKEKPFASYCSVTVVPTNYSASIGDQRTVVVRPPSMLARVQMLNSEFCLTAVADVGRDQTFVHILMRPFVNLVLFSRLGKKHKNKIKGNKTEPKKLESDWTNLLSVVLQKKVHLDCLTARGLVGDSARLSAVLLVRRLVIYK